MDLENKELSGTVISLSERSREVVAGIRRLLGSNWNYLQFDKASGRSLSDIFKKAWSGDAIVSVMASAITIRSISSLIDNKKNDPAVVGVDEEGRFAVSLLGGHLAGANELAKKIADGILATAVVSTASDLKELPAIDMIAKEMGFVIENENAVPGLMSRLIDRKKIHLFTDVAKRRFEDIFTNTSVKVFSINEAEAVYTKTGEQAFNIYVSDASKYMPGDKTVIFHPKDIFIGIGCRRGTDFAVIKRAVDESLTKCGISPLSVAGVATINIKKDEQGLIEYSKFAGAGIKFFTAEELAAENDANGLANGSEFVKDNVGVEAVSAPAALLAAGHNPELLLNKNIVEGVTVSIARANWPLSE